MGLRAYDSLVCVYSVLNKMNVIEIYNCIYGLVRVAQCVCVGRVCLHVLIKIK